METPASRGPGPGRSRRERPAKPPLSRQGIVDVALAIMRDEGLGRVTMRRIAAALDTGPASLYVYIRDTADLHAQLLDALLGPLTGAPPTSGDWRDRLSMLLTAYSRILFDHPEIARMAMSTQPSGPNYLALVEAVLALLDEGGVDDQGAAWGVDLLLLYATATGTEQGIRRRSPHIPAELSALSAALAGADPSRFPQIGRLGSALMEGDGADRFQWGLDALLSGIVALNRRVPEHDGAGGGPTSG